MINLYLRKDLLPIILELKKRNVLMQETAQSCFIELGSLLNALNGELCGIKPVSIGSLDCNEGGTLK